MTERTGGDAASAGMPASYGSVPGARDEGAAGGAVCWARAMSSTVRIDAPAEAVWRALTEAEELRRWFPTDARVTPGVGGKVLFVWRDFMEGEASIEVWDEGRRLRTAFDCGPGVVADDYIIEGAGGATTLRVVTSGFGRGAAWDDMYDCMRTGWLFELSGLKHYLEWHRGVDRLVAWARVRTAHARGEALSRALGPACLGVEGAGGLKAGGAFRARTVLGDVWTGRVRAAEPGMLLAATVSELNDALLRVESSFVPAPGEVEAWVWLSAYGVDAGRVSALEAGLLGALRSALA